MSKAHAKFSPSSAERWMKCPGSVALSAKCEKRQDSRAAIEGTRAHYCLEMLIKNGEKKNREVILFLSQKHDPEMISYAYGSAERIWRERGKRRLESEKRCFLPQVDKDLWGTLDITLIEHFGDLEIRDFKYGKFIPVEAKENPQLLTYAAGEAHRHKYNFDSVTLSIDQPRSEHPDGPVRKWKTTVPRIREWERELKEAVAATRDKNAPTVAGEHCFFCDAKGICPSFTPEATQRLRNRIISDSIEAKQPSLDELFGPEPKKRPRAPW